MAELAELILAHHTRPPPNVLLTSQSVGAPEQLTDDLGVALANQPSSCRREVGALTLGAQALCCRCRRPLLPLPSRPGR